MAKPLPPSLLDFLGFRPTGDIGPYTFYTASNGAVIFYPKAPPLTPPTWLQTQQRNRFRFAAAAWRSLTPQTRSDWEIASRQAGLRINGYDLFVHYTLVRNPRTIQTIERISGVQLLDPT